MRDEAFKLQDAAARLDGYLEVRGMKQEAPDREIVMNMVHAINMAYGAWAWDVDRNPDLGVH